MIIHIVLAGETPYTIADYYGISSDWLIRENELTQPNNLAVGETILILFPKLTHTIARGDTLYNIATTYNVTVMDLLRNNSYLAIEETLTIGETIVVKYEDVKSRNISTYRYCYPGIDEEILRRSLPYLTYLIIFSYFIDGDGQFGELDVSRIIEYARVYGVGPIMQVSFDNEKGLSETDLAHNILNDESLSNALMEDILNSLSENGYSGIGLYSIYIYPNDRELYFSFVEKLINRVKEMGLLVVETIVPETFELITDIFEFQPCIRFINELSDVSIIFPMSVGIRLTTPVGESNSKIVKDMIERFSEYSSSKSVKLGINTVGYIWDLPYIPCVSEGHPISLPTITQLARDYNIAISFDEGTNAAYFLVSDHNKERLVRFSDLRSFVTSLDTADYFDLDALGIWNVLSFIGPLWLILGVRYYINKIDL